MGFTDKLAGMLKKKEMKKRESISFETLEPFIKRETSREEKRILDESAPYVEGILSGAQNLSRFLEGLKEMERQEMFKRLDRIVKNSQKRFADSLTNVVTRIRLGPKTYEGLETFYSEVIDALQQIQKLTAMHGKYLYLAFDREMKEFSRTAKEIAAHHRMLGNLLEAERESLNILQEIKSHIQEWNSLIEELHHIEETNKKSHQAIHALESDISHLESTIQKLQSSEEYQDLFEAEKQKEDLAQRLKSIEGEIYNVLHPLDRDFRKFKRQVELGHFSFDVKLLEKYEHLTEQFLTENEGYPNLKKIAQSMKEALEKQVIKEKGHKRQKVMDIMNTILNDGLLTLQREYHSTRVQLDAQVYDKQILETLTAVKKEMEEKKSAIEELKMKIKTNTEKGDEITEMVGELKGTIEEKCRDIGIDIE